MVNLGLKCFLTSPGENFIKLLSRPYSTMKELKCNASLYSKWIQYLIELYNSRSEFLLLANTKMNGYNTLELEIIHNNYKVNYKQMKEGFKQIDYEKNYKNFNTTIQTLVDTNFIDPILNDESMYKLEIENYNPYIEMTIFRMTIFIFQYLHNFEDKSINLNLWNYCLKSCSISFRSTIIGLLTLICQYVWTGTLVYEITQDFNPTNSPSIILITVVSTIVSIYMVMIHFVLLVFYIYV